MSDAWVHGIRRPGERLDEAKRRAQRDRVPPSEGMRGLMRRVDELRARGLDDLEVARRLCVAKCWPRRGPSDGS